MSMVTPISISTKILNNSFFSRIEDRLTLAFRKDLNALSSEVDEVIRSFEDSPNSMYLWKELTDWVIKNNCIKVLQNAIQHKEIGQESVEQIFSYSAMHWEENDCQKTLLLLINSSNFCKVSDQNLSGAFLHMLQHGQIKAVKSILNTARDKLNYLRPDFFCYTRIQKLVLHEATHNQEMLLNILDTVFTWAIENSCKDFIRAIIENSGSQEKGEQKIFKENLQDRCIQRVLEYIPSGKIHDEVKEVILDAALSSGSNDLVEILIGES